MKIKQDVSDTKVIEIGIFVSALLFAFLLYPRTGVGDIDAIIYMIGTYSIRAGVGYRDFVGNTITTWPPGFSWLLAFFPFSPLSSATIFNNFLFALSCVLLYLLARNRGWTRLYAVTLTAVIAAGFYRSIAFFAKPDMLTYALFLIGLLLYWQSQSERVRIVLFTIWNLLIPIKLVTAVITPAALLSEFISNRRNPQRPFTIRSYLYPLGSWLVSLGGLLAYNRWVSTDAMPKSHAPASVLGFFQEIFDFFTSLPRSALTYWYGTLRDPIALALFGLSLGLAILALLTLRPVPSERQRWYFGIFLLLLTFALLAVRKFDAQMRTMGYGVLVLLLLWRPIPTKWARVIWSAYAVVMVGVAIVNVALVNTQGANHAMYENLVQEIAPAIANLPNSTLYTNGYYITEIHAGVPSITSSTLPPATKGNYYLLVTLPNVDGIMTTVLEAPAIDSNWCSVIEGTGGTLYQPCTP